MRFGGFDHPYDRVPQELDDLVAAREPVVVVVALEAVEVGVEAGEARAISETALDLERDLGVAGKLRDRIQAAEQLPADEHRARSGEELRRIEGLHDVIIGAGVEVRDPILHRGMRRQQDHGDVARPVLAAERAQHIRAGESGQADVEEDEVGRIREHGMEGLLAARRLRALEAV